MGDAYDNEVIEPQHSALESGLWHLEQFGTRAQAGVEVMAWIEEYHHDKQHFCPRHASPRGL